MRMNIQRITETSPSRMVRKSSCRVKFDVEGPGCGGVCQQQRERFVELLTLVIPRWAQSELLTRR